MKKKGQTTEADVELRGLEETEVLMASNEDNTSQGKGWIFDSSSIVHVCSQKKPFNSLVAKEKGIVKMVDGLSCKVISTGTVMSLALGKSRLQKEIGRCKLWRRSGIF